MEDRKTPQAFSTPVSGCSSKEEDRGSLKEGDRGLALEFIRVLRETGYPEEHLPTVETILPLAAGAPEFMKNIASLTSANVIPPILREETSISSAASVSQRTENELNELLGLPENRIRVISSDQDVIDSEECLKNADLKLKLSGKLIKIIGKRSVTSKTNARRLRALHADANKYLLEQKRDCVVATLEAKASVTCLCATLNEFFNCIDNAIDTEPTTLINFADKKKLFFAEYEGMIKDILVFLKDFDTLNIMDFIYPFLRYKEHCLKKALIESGCLNMYEEFLESASFSDVNRREDIKRQIQDFLQPFEEKSLLEANKLLKEKLLSSLNWNELEKIVVYKTKLKQLIEKWNSFTDAIRLPLMTIQLILELFAEVVQNNIDIMGETQQNVPMSEIEVIETEEDNFDIVELTETLQQVEAVLQSKQADIMRLVLGLNNFVRNECQDLIKARQHEKKAELVQEMANLNRTIETFQAENAEFLHFCENSYLAKFFINLKSLSNFRFATFDASSIYGDID